MSYVPVPATTVARSPTASTAAANRSSFSSSESVGDSPVVPETTRPSEPWSTRCAASSRNASRSTDPSARERRDDRGQDLAQHLRDSTAPTRRGPRRAGIELGPVSRVLLLAVRERRHLRRHRLRRDDRRAAEELDPPPAAGAELRHEHAAARLREKRPAQPVRRPRRRRRPVATSSRVRLRRSIGGRADAPLVRSRRRRRPPSIPVAPEDVARSERPPPPRARARAGPNGAPVLDHPSRSAPPNREAKNCASSTRRRARRP